MKTKLIGFGKGSSSVAPAFGVRRLDAALAFGAAVAEHRFSVACDSASDVYAREVATSSFTFRSAKKSGVKPPHSKASRHSGDASIKEAML